ncbi:N-acetyltransferase [Paenibacillus baekrokdamisoli]|uniref:N-acetyltransferase n=1 Tax=Paenibacillus baekrokdamisoli TaxID=1712516 RepID=A0A3G9IMN2_9BACL|nr:GNAT family N-acetyltransferase [Paenibacillus baekrokdamisoli]MBB3070751.1 RimJ/RimL family protein N-acetyltransferase [Paenibacillus baekrokdamisoli]BBH20100.1 N-acetyltransferase [Paenibacillus baekrokdamisoli]
MKTLFDVELQFYKPGNFESLKSFNLPEEQEQFTALPIESLDITHERYPIIIVSKNEIVGFFVLHSSARVKEYTENPHSMLLTALSINHTQQGKGFAKKGMELLKGFVNQEFPECNEIVLAVNNRNIPAQKLYEKVGYKDTCRRKMGEIGEQLILSLSV